LEIGCASGPNLYLLAKKFPEIKLYGIDISKKAIEIGKKKFNEEKILNVILETGNPSDLQKFFNKSIDIIFSDACLIYISPKKINSVVEEMVRIAKKAIILCEQHSDNSNSFYNGNWGHNYKPSPADHSRDYPGAGENFATPPNHEKSYPASAPD